jgi:outer membrane PBP1 activator LpoA protein
MKYFKHTIILTTALLIGCAAHAPYSNPVTAASPETSLPPPPSFYLTQAKTATGLIQQQYLLQAVTSYFAVNDYINGASILAQINPVLLDANGNAEYQVLSAKLAFHNGDISRAQTLLTPLGTTPNLSTSIQTETLITQADIAYKQGDLLKSVQLRVQLTPLLTDAEKRIGQQQLIWQMLNQMPLETIKLVSSDATNPTLQAWAQLNLLTRTQTNNPAALLTALRDWQRQHPDHPAAFLLDADIAHLENLFKVPAQVAVLLPLNGPLAEQANAILNGILLVYYSNRSKNFPTPTLRIYDTSANNNVAAIYQQAIQDGAQFVIGPLTKSNVDKLKSHGQVTVPTLALNYGLNDTTINNFYEFALSPENDAEQIVARVATQPNLRALIMTPAGQWGKNVATAFEQAWTAHHNIVVGTLTFDSNKILTNDIGKVLHIDESNARQAALQRLVGHKLKFSPRRRQDVDIIFINAFPAQAREILPLLRFYYAGSIPVYATSIVYTGMPNAQHDKDLNNLQFTIMPWVITPTLEAQALRKQAETLWSKNFKSNSQLYGFGIDAYDAMIRLNQTKKLPANGLPGNSGTLMLQKDHRIRANLLWAQFQQGLPVVSTN